MNLRLSINLSSSNAVGGASEPPQFTADWGNINPVNDLSPTLFWASTSGAQTNVNNATAITVSGLSKNISITLSGVGNLRYAISGDVFIYTGSFSVTNGDVIKIGMLGPTIPPIDPASGNITVTNSTDSYTIDTIPYYIEAMG
jgi:hypothetical protein